MKKVLIIANLFHASPRIPGLAKYLPQFGWQPIILTTPIGEKPDSRFGPPDDFIKSGIRIIETPYTEVSPFWRRTPGLSCYLDKEMSRQIKERLRIVYTAWESIFCYPDAHKHWIPIASKKIDKLLQEESIDAVISSSSPVTSHIIAKELKIKHKIPWVADLRDLWTQNHNYPYGPLRKTIEKRLELKTLEPADALVTVSKPWTEKLATLHKGKATYTITNGFDPERMSKGEIDLTSKFTITYTGNIYYGKQDPSKLFAALKDLFSNGTMNPKDVEVRFYGIKHGILAREIKKYGLSANVKQYGMVPRQISFEKQRESQLLLILNWEDPLIKGWYPLKIFEYLGAQRPILATGGFGDDVIKELLDETRSGMYGSTIEDIKSILRELYLEYKNKGKIIYNGVEKEINKYSYREMAKKFAKILDSLIEGCE